jgi:NAD(P)-dependent dehydrogenase (short-subunit alcohol dehydrogenase family)
MSDNADPSVQQLFDLSGRVALITGADGYLGFSMARALAEAGCRVVVASLNLKTARRTTAKLNGAQKNRHLSVAINHMSESSIRRGFTSAVKQAGHIDVLVNNGHEPIAADWRSVTGSQFTRQLANATGYFLLARLLRDHAAKRRAGASVIMLGSMYGQVASYPDVYEGLGPANPVAYQTVKGGIIQLTRHLAVYWARDGVRVNCLSPGPFPAPGVSPQLVARLKRKSPMKRMGRPSELKGAVVFLASDASSYVTGQNLTLDGGWTAW